MSRRNQHKIIPLSCRDCVHIIVDRCGVTGHAAHWQTNAPWHCEKFVQYKRRNDPQKGLAR